VQAPCPHCDYKIVIDDARVPDRAFSVKCPKCKKAVRFPGKAAAKQEEAADSPAAAAPAAPPPADPPPAAPPAAPIGATGTDMSLPGRPPDASPDDVYAMVALPDTGQAGAITLTLSRLGYHVDTLENWEEGTRLLDTASFDVVVTTHTASAKGGFSPYQKLTRMPLEFRRNMTVLLIADDVVTSDGNQAFKLQADMVINSGELATAGMAVREVMFERKRIYQAYVDALTRLEHDV